MTTVVEAVPAGILSVDVSLRGPARGPVKDLVKTSTLGGVRLSRKIKNKISVDSTKTFSEAYSGNAALAIHEVSEEADEKLVLAVQHGDMAAFRSLYDRHHQKVFYLAIGIVKNAVDAEDVVQEAFIKAYKSLDSFRGQSSFYTWLYRIVTNIAIDFTRRQKRRVEVAVEGIDVSGVVDRQSFAALSLGLANNAGPDELLERNELRQHFDTAMNELSADHRAVVILREIDGLSYTEISEIVGCSKGTVMSRLHHARKKLQSALQEFFPKRKVSNNDSELSSVQASVQGAK